MVARVHEIVPSMNWGSLKKYALPMILAILLIGALNYGLYGRLAPKQAFVPYVYPYAQDFTNVDLKSWIQYGGDWHSAGGQLAQTKSDPASIYLPFSVSEKDAYIAQVRIKPDQVGASLSFNAQYPALEQNRQTVQIVPRDGKWQMVYGYYQKGSQIREQGAIPLNVSENQLFDGKLTVSVTNDRYALRLDDNLLVSNVPLMYKGGLIGLNSLGGSSQFDDFSVNQVGAAADSTGTPQAVITGTPQPVVDTGNTENPVLYSSQFTGNLNDSGWKSFAGDWAFDNNNLIQRQLDGFDLGIVNDKMFQNYQVAVTFAIQQGNSAGLLFNLPQRESKNGGQLVRYTDDGKGLFWGYFDNQGAFTGQGYADTPAPVQDAHVITVQSRAETYSVNLDGKLLADNIPLNSRQGYIGLTTAQSTAKFANVTVTNIGSNTGVVTKPVDLLANSQTVTGQWTHTVDGVTQTLSEAADYVTGIGVLAEQYVIESDITLPTDLPDSGAGFIFHMPTRDALPGAYMLRIGEGGKIVFWGRYDDKGVFAGQGSIDVNLAAGTPHHLAVTVKTKTFDIAVDGNTITHDLPLEQSSGWIGLVSFRGPVVFSQLRLTLGVNQQ